MRRIRRNWMALLLAALLLLGLTACGDDEESAAPEEGAAAEAPAEPEPLMYELEGIQVAALETPEGTIPAPRYSESYFYDNLSVSGSETAGAYAEQLAADGFRFLDEELVEAEAPALDTETGSVLLGKKAVFPAPEPPAEDAAGTDGEADEEADDAAEAPAEAPPPEDQVLLMRLDWTAADCTVTISLVPGVITVPPDPEEVAAEVAAEAMTNQELEEYVQTLPPSVFGLPGSSMSEYHVYIQSGMVTVNEIPCQRLEIFHIDEESGTNEVAGSFFMSSNGEYLYRYDILDGQITELEVPPREPEAE